MTQQGNTGDKKRVFADTPHYSVDFLFMLVDSIADPWMSCLGKTDHDLFPKSEADVFWAWDDKVFTSGQPIENEELRK